VQWPTAGRKASAALLAATFYVSSNDVSLYLWLNQADEESGKNQKRDRQRRKYLSLNFETISKLLENKEEFSNPSSALPEADSLFQVKLKKGEFSCAGPLGSWPSHASQANRKEPTDSGPLPPPGSGSQDAPGVSLPVIPVRPFLQRLEHVPVHPITQGYPSPG
jgi:hypothetical protein